LNNSLCGARRKNPVGAHLLAYQLYLNKRQIGGGFLEKILLL